MIQKILVVDDEPDILFLIQDELQTNGFACDLAHNVDEAASLLAQHDYALVVCDMRLPGQSGAEILKKIQQLSAKASAEAKPKAIVVSGYSDITREQAFELGAIAYLEKPFRLKELMTAVRLACMGLVKK